MRHFLCFMIISILAACQNVYVPVSSQPDGSVPKIAEPSLRQKIGQMIMVGFQGTSCHDPDVKQLIQKAQCGEIGGVIFFGYNIVDPVQIQTLTAAFRSQKFSYPLLLALDQEGGKVQRLNSKKGFPNFFSARELAKQGLGAAKAHYTSMAQTVHQAGFNVVLGPVVDLEYDQETPQSQPNQVIGQLERSYGSDPKTVVDYAGSYIDAFHAMRILTTLKHFPGHGLAVGDTHRGMVDITSTHKKSELLPFYQLIHQDKVDMIMTAHLMHRRFDPYNPATLSKKILIPLLRDQGYQGVIITDCLNMGAIQSHYGLEEAVLKAIEAGVDIVLISNNDAVQGINSQKQERLHHVPSAKIVDRVIQYIERAIQQGRLSEAHIQTSFERISKIKNKWNTNI